VVTFEFENIPLEALSVIEPLCPVRPGARALAVSQDRLAEKEFLNALGIATAPFARFDRGGDPAGAVTATGLPAIIKTRRMGYDGKGQIRVDHLSAAKAAMETLAGRPAIIEGHVDFSLEASVIGARSFGGDVVCFDPGANVHHNGILHTTTVPAPLSLSQKTDAVLLAGRVMNALDYVGVMAVELFVTGGGLIVNEIAPRVHNSGHWTQNGCVIDQFEQHVRAVAGWPLGDGRRHSDVVMTNLIGHDVDDVRALDGDAQVGVHLYGKQDVRTGRKMGHINKVTGAAR